MEAVMEQYLETRSSIFIEIAKLNEALEEHMSENIQALNWAHVGDMTHILAQLKQLNEGK